MFRKENSSQILTNQKADMTTSCYNMTDKACILETAFKLIKDDANLFLHYKI